MNGYRRVRLLKCKLKGNTMKEVAGAFKVYTIAIMKCLGNTVWLETALLFKYTDLLNTRSYLSTLHAWRRGHVHTVTISSDVGHYVLYPLLKMSKQLTGWSSQSEINMFLNSEIILYCTDGIQSMCLVLTQMLFLVCCFPK